MAATALVGTVAAGYLLRKLVAYAGAPPPIEEPQYETVIHSRLDLVDELIQIKYRLFGRPLLTVEQLVKDVEAAANESMEEEEVERLRAGMAAMLHYLNGPRVAGSGRAMLYGTVRDGLRNRVRALVAAAKDASLRREQPLEMVFVIGLPRTGSTLTQRLLATHPHARTISICQCMDLDPASAATEEEVKEKCKKLFKMMRWVLGQAMWDKMQQVHPIGDGTAPEEDQALLQASLIHEEFLGNDAYREWMLAHDATSAYELHNIFLNTLLRRYPEDGARHWLLKAPIHTFFLDALLKQYPNAKFVWTHRDPKKSMGSSCSMRSMMRMVDKPLDKRDFSKRFLKSDMESLRRAMEVRRRIGEERFTDVYFKDLMDSPQDTLVDVHARVFGKCEEEETFRANIAAWLEEDAKDKPPRHAYNLDDYGVPAKEVDRHFAWYYDIFDKSRM